MTRALISKIVKALSPGDRAGHWLRQRGGAILPMAVAGLLGTSLIAVPLLDRAINGLQGTKNAASVQVLDAEAAAWYAMWRLQHDPTIHTEFSGTPLTTTFNFRGANITVVGVESPANVGIVMSLVATPNTALPNTPTVVTYTLTVRNDDDQAHNILRLEADPSGSFSPTYVPTSTTGMTTVEPATSGNRFTWTPLTPVTLAPFGAQASLTWQMTVDESEGNYWMDAEVRIEGVGDIEGLTEANILVTPTNDVKISAVVDPSQIIAYVDGDFDHTITIENTGSNNYTITDIKFWATKELDITPGTSAGVTTDEPRRNSDSMSNDRWEWTWDNLSVPFNAGQTLTQTFTADGGLSPGTWFSEAALKTVESSANGQEVAATSSATAPIKAVRLYAIDVDHLNSSLNIEALLDDTGLETLTWEEY